ncbi:alkaline phosphatase [Histoplasma capsulatum G186AR]|uniref:Alkaline phosphatase n=2 Tax=Ajellomyces capsulatus TaxID=5037 RepID=C0NBI7_AJECG|nr:alkaline phosphatase [Histoplasma capsulatum G186AR]EEH11028.1 alkaline phosphatase [Histoplasma capsulatum G186AR]KAG5303120.1 alkaline phosphatase [Histoplasma capsulatum]QSS71478.1 alkaline phosphatase [Histoplasma capsulatum G186AR]
MFDSRLAQRSSSEHSERSGEEEDALLTGQPTNRNGERHRSLLRELGLFAWAVIATVAVITLGVLYQHQTQNKLKLDPGTNPSGKRNLIFMVSDGMGPASLSLTRSFRQFESKLPMDDILVLDQHHIGSSRTRSSSSLVTDSAAGATAFSCGMKSYNGAISVLPDKSPCGTILEAAKLAGYMTGLVVTTRVTDATPACFASHANMRSYEDLIAEQEIGNYPLGRMVDLIMGGGRCHFIPNSADGSCRRDDKDVVRMAKANGFSYIHDRAGFDSLQMGSNVTLPLLGLLAAKDIPFEVDRSQMTDVYPSLEEMTRTALKALSEATKDSEKGFFIMIEGSRIDHGGHGNDPVAQVHEVLAYDKAFSAALEFLKTDSTPGILVATSDHETGGLSIAKQLHADYPEYLWYPGVLANASHSSEYLGNALDHYLANEGKNADDPNRRNYIRNKLLGDGLGIHDATDAEVQKLMDGGGAYAFADMVSRRAQIGWSTHGHSGVDVNIYASSAHDAMPLVGNHENTEVGLFLQKYLSLDLHNVTKRLKDTKSSPHVSGDGSGNMYPWMGEPLDDGVVVDELDRYHGDFKRRTRGESADQFLLDHEDLESEGCSCGSTKH